ncbi:MAG: 16S rRNA (guanine(966)-N(2))-methyltransferase RsmD [Gemmatimonadaceae bacterium]|nr:16S rRNA (guanine(966)-N(2))-methyltransferase RsmD [Gloeobacterales cyanobacterium ES-bin-141]
MSLRIYGNRLLRTPQGLTVRPTAGRVREAVFGRWFEQVEGCRWLDLCAGAGTMGAEALARGAESALGIEQSRATAQIATANWQKVAPGRGDIWTVDVRTGLARLANTGQFDLIYFDPPYQSGLYLPVLEAIDHHGLLAPTGEMAAEHAWDAPPGPPGLGLVCVDRRVYGRTAVSYYRSVTSPIPAAILKDTSDECG